LHTLLAHTACTHMLAHTACTHRLHTLLAHTACTHRLHTPLAHTACTHCLQERDGLIQQRDSLTKELQQTHATLQVGMGEAWCWG